MSIVKNKNFSYLRGPKGDKGDKGDPGSGVAYGTGRIVYNSVTKTIGFNEEGLATVNYVNASINNLINGAPLVLDTLNELAAAIDNNPNFVTTITANINGKLSLSGGTLTGKLNAAQGAGTTGGYSFGGTEGGNDTGMFSNADGILDFYANNVKIITVTTGSVTSTKAITLPADPTSNLQAATKQYVDNATSSITITDTTDVPEGTNLYYTDVRFDTRFATKTTTNLTEGSNQYFTTARARSAISVSGDLSYDNSTGVISYTAPIGFSGSYTDLINKPVFSTVATSGSYNDLTNKPTDILSNVDITTVAPSIGDMLSWDGTHWVPSPSVSSIISTASLNGGEY